MVTDDPYKRDSHVVIQKPTTTTTAGKPTTTWADFALAWVAVVPLGSQEDWKAKRAESNITHAIIGTWDDFENVTADFRIVYGTRTFNLTETPRNVEEANVTAEMRVEEAKR